MSSVTSQAVLVTVMNQYNYNGLGETKSGKRDPETSVGCVPACDVIYVSDCNNKNCNTLHGEVNFFKTGIN